MGKKEATLEKFLQSKSRDFWGREKKKKSEFFKISSPGRKQNVSHLKEKKIGRRKR